MLTAFITLDNTQFAKVRALSKVQNLEQMLSELDSEGGKSNDEN